MSAHRERDKVRALVITPPCEVGQRRKNVLKRKMGV